MLWLLTLLTTLALGTSGGFYLEPSIGYGRTNHTGVHSPTRLQLAAGYFGGNYTGTRRFGAYWRGGATLQYTWADSPDTQVGDRKDIKSGYQAYTLGAELVRGADLVEIGAYAGLGVGVELLDTDLAWRPSYLNYSARGTLGAMYIISAGIAFNIQVDLGFKYAAQLPQNVFDSVKTKRRLHPMLLIRFGSLLRFHHLDGKSRRQLKAKRIENRAWREAQKKKNSTLLVDTLSSDPLVKELAEATIAYNQAQRQLAEFEMRTDMRRIEAQYLDLRLKRNAQSQGSPQNPKVMQALDTDMASTEATMDEHQSLVDAVTHHKTNREQIQNKVQSRNKGAEQ